MRCVITQRYTVLGATKNHSPTHCPTKGSHTNKHLYVSSERQPENKPGLVAQHPQTPDNDERENHAPANNGEKTQGAPPIMCAYARKFHRRASIYNIRDHLHREKALRM
jgi:hypothetical protein